MLVGVYPDAHVTGVEAVEVTDVRAHHGQVPGQYKADVQIQVLRHLQLAVVAAYLIEQRVATAQVALDEVLGPEDGLQHFARGLKLPGVMGVAGGPRGASGAAGPLAGRRLCASRRPCRRASRCQTRGAQTKN